MGTQLSSRLAVKDSEAGVEGAIDSFNDHRNVMTTRSAFFSATGNEIVRSIFWARKSERSDSVVEGSHNNATISVTL